MRHETVLFDLDGTLIDSGSLILASFRHATQTVLGRRIPDQALMANVGGHGIHAQMREFDAERVDELVEVYRDHNLASYHEVRAFPGIREALARLRAQDRRLGIVTAKGSATVALTIQLLPFLGELDTVVSGDDTARHKPHPDGLLLALERLGTDAGSAAYVGDSPFDIGAAKAARMTAVAAGWGGIHPLTRLEAEGPDAVVRAPGELVDAL
ncbi:MAG: HAD-IA family hydrolase [Gaiellales bacterium]